MKNRIKYIENAATRDKTHNTEMRETHIRIAKQITENRNRPWNPKEMLTQEEKINLKAMTKVKTTKKTTLPSLRNHNRKKK